MKININKYQQTRLNIYLELNYYINQSLFLMTLNVRSKVLINNLNFQNLLRKNSKDEAYIYKTDEHEPAWFTLLVCYLPYDRCKNN